MKRNIIVLGITMLIAFALGNLNMYGVLQYNKSQEQQPEKVEQAAKPTIKILQVGDPIRFSDPTMQKLEPGAMVAGYERMDLAPAGPTIFFYIVQTPTRHLLVNFDAAQLDADDDLYIQYIPEPDRLAAWLKTRNKELCHRDGRKCFASS